MDFLSDSSVFCADGWIQHLDAPYSLSGAVAVTTTSSALEPTPHLYLLGGSMQHPTTPALNPTFAALSLECNTSNCQYLTSTTATGFSHRRRHIAIEYLYFDGLGQDQQKLFVIGGQSLSNSAALNDIWTASTR